jgi:hypothetical protein
MNRDILANVHAWNADAMRRAEASAHHARKNGNDNAEREHLRHAKRHRGNCDALEGLM